MCVLDPRGVVIDLARDLANSSPSLALASFVKSRKRFLDFRYDFWIGFLNVIVILCVLDQRGVVIDLAHNLANSSPSLTIALFLKARIQFWTLGMISKQDFKCNCYNVRFRSKRSCYRLGAWFSKLFAIARHCTFCKG